MRAAIYARLSVDNDGSTSVPDQLKACRAVAERMGAHVVREFFDDGISGQAMGNRPGVRELMEFARTRQCDVVIAEHTDRLARKGQPSFKIFEDFKRWGVKYVTVMEDRVTVLKQAVSVLVSEHKLEEATHRTVRGLQGRVEAGRSGGGLTYGYKVRRLYDERGEPIRGHLDVDEPKADVVRRIFREYAAGASSLAIAAGLNADSIPAPRGGLWNASTISGNARRGNGVIHNQLYVGLRVWGRQTFSKDPETGARKGRLVEPGEREILREAVDQLRIVDDGLWARAQARYAEASRVTEGGASPGRANRPKRFLQGLLTCGLCGAPMWKAGPRDALRCSTRIAKGACANTKAPGYAGIEARVISAIKANLLHPDVIEHAVRKVREGLAAAQRDLGRQRAKIEGELAEVTRRMDRLIDQLEEGTPWSAIADRHGKLQARREALTGDLSAGHDPVVSVLPAPGQYRKLVEDLQAAMDDPEGIEGREGREAVRRLIHEVRVTPGEGHGDYELEILGDLAPLLMLGTNENGPLAGAVAAQSMSDLGAGTRFTRRHTPLAEVRMRA